MLSEFKVNELEIHKYILEPINSNMYLIVKNKSALIIDPHICQDAVEFLEQKTVEEIWIILTHEHFDHISGVNFFREHWSCTVLCGNHAKEYLTDPLKNLSAYFKSLLIDKDAETVRIAEEVFDENYSCYADIGFDGRYGFEWQGLDIQLIETPGHSKGSICILVEEQYVFTGDSLVADNAVITRLPGGSKKEYRLITKPFLEGLSKDTIVFPGHGKENILNRFEIT
ncbi:MAG: MBL fold metallo-hydrolase [Lachnospiraceae bacterium]|nr:MBL fold metallo-hydrolase [Lachnospiraceae bacterium]